MPSIVTPVRSRSFFAARFLFGVPMVGNLGLLPVVALVFIAANLAVGITFSTVAKKSTRGRTDVVLFLFAALLLSGFIFPFRGTPHWAQAVGEIFPLTHFCESSVASS